MMKLQKIAAALLAASLSVAALAGCGGSAASSTAPAGDSSSAAPETSQASSQAGAAGGQLVVGLDDQFPPMGFRDEKNELVGFDIDLIKAVGEELGMEVVLTPIDWSTKELEVNGDKVDLLWNGLTITDDRKESMLISPAYIANAQVVIVKKDAGIAKLADLEGKTVGLQDTSSADEAFSAAEVSQKCEIVRAADNISLLNDLKIGRLDGVVIDKVVADYYISMDTQGSTLTLLTEQLADEEYGVAFKKGNTELADKVCGAFMEIIKSGKGAEISKKWFGEDRLIFEYPAK